MSDHQTLMTDLPEKVKVGPHVYEVRVADPNPDAEGRLGTSDHLNRVIAISELASTRPQQAINTFIHEVIHCVDQCYQTKLEEDQVERLANGLCDALQGIGWLPIDLGRVAPPPPPGVYKPGRADGFSMTTYTSGDRVARSWGSGDWSRYPATGTTDLDDYFQPGGESPF